jgi:hypothetical protein
MSPHTSTGTTASPRQLRYLKDLALETGVTFTFPKTGRKASYEIDRLKKLKATRGRHVEVPRHHLDPAEEPYATEQKPGETIGYGSSARRRDPLPGNLAPTPAPASGPSDDEPLELGRYETDGGEVRALYQIWIEGKPRIIDAAAQGRGRIYTVQQEVQEEDGYQEVKDIVAAYIEQAGELGRIPMASMRSAS